MSSSLRFRLVIFLIGLIAAMAFRSHSNSQAPSKTDGKRAAEMDTGGLAQPN